MKCEMAFLLDVPNRNGRVYTRKSFLKKVDDKLEEHHLFLADRSDYSRTESIDFSSILGIINYYDIQGDKVIFDVRLINEGRSLEGTNIKISPITLSSIDRYNRVIINKLICFNILPNMEAE